jgi:hypothetical protein
VRQVRCPFSGHGSLQHQRSTTLRTTPCLGRSVIQAAISGSSLSTDAKRNRRSRAAIPRTASISARCCPTHTERQLPVSRTSSAGGHTSDFSGFRRIRSEENIQTQSILRMWSPDSVGRNHQREFVVRMFTQRSTRVGKSPTKRTRRGPKRRIPLTLFCLLHCQSDIGRVHPAA